MTPQPKPRPGTGSLPLSRPPRLEVSACRAHAYIEARRGSECQGFQGHRVLLSTNCRRSARYATFTTREEYVATLPRPTPTGRLDGVNDTFSGELAILRADNLRLRRLLDLSEEQARAARPYQPTLTGAPTPPVLKASPMRDKVRFYADLFGCRADVYAARWENKRDGRSGWTPTVAGGYWPKDMSRAEAQYLPLTPDVIAKHLDGQMHIGLYPLLDDGTCWWVAADFDKEAAMLDALAFIKAAREHGIPAALEVSQSGPRRPCVDLLRPTDRGSHRAADRHQPAR